MKKSRIIIGVIVALAALAMVGTALPKPGKKPVRIFINVPALTTLCVAHPECKSSAAIIKAAWDRFAAQYRRHPVVLEHGRVNEFPQTAYTRNISRAYGTATCPDLTFGGFFMMSEYIYDGHVIPLDDIISDRLRAEISPDIWAQAKGGNGRVYLLPFFGLQNILAYNKDLFRQCGLERFIAADAVVQGWSLEEWDTVLATLAEKLPRDRYPMMMYAKNNQGDTHIMVQLRCKGSDFFNREGLFNLNTPEGVAGLQWLKDNRDKGYYIPDRENLEINDASALFSNGQLAIFVWNESIRTTMEGLDVGYVNFPARTPAGAHSSWLTGFMAFDNGDPDRIEVVKDFLRFIYETPELLDYSTCGRPCVRSVRERWSGRMPYGRMLDANPSAAVDVTANNPNWAGVRAAFWPHIQALLQGRETAAEAAAGLDRDCNRAILSVKKVLHD